MGDDKRYLDIESITQVANILQGGILNKLVEDVGEIKSDVNDIKVDVAELKVEVANLKAAKRQWLRDVGDFLAKVHDNKVVLVIEVALAVKFVPALAAVVEKWFAP